MKDYHLSYDPPVLNADERPLFPYKKIELTEEDKEDIAIALMKRDCDFYREYEGGYVYAGGFINSK